MLRPKQSARIGTFYLQESVLDVLLDIHQEGVYGLGTADISRRAGIYRDPGVVNMNDAIVTGLLNELYDQNKVVRAKQENNKGGWRLSNEEFERRRDDV